MSPVTVAELINGILFSVMFQYTIRWCLTNKNILVRLTDWLKHDIVGIISGKSLNQIVYRAINDDIDLQFKAEKCLHEAKCKKCCIHKSCTGTSSHMCQETTSSSMGHEGVTPLNMPQILDSPISQVDDEKSEGINQEIKNIPWKIDSQNFILGSGSFGIVVQVKMKNTHEAMAVKVLRSDVLDKGGQLRKQARNELNCSLTLNHPHLVKVVEGELVLGSHLTSNLKVNPNDYFLCILMELVDGCDLNRKIKEGLSFAEIRKYMFHLFSAVSYLKSQRIYHRDIKPSNILITKNGVLKLTDFGLAKIVTKLCTTTHTYCGTKRYMAPEIRKAANEQTAKYSYKADVWSCGCVLHDMVTMETTCGILYDMRNRFLTKKPDDLLKAIFDGCLVENPSQRWDPEIFLKMNVT